jgi:hypothetical protein
LIQFTSSTRTISPFRNKVAKSCKQPKTRPRVGTKKPARSKHPETHLGVGTEKGDRSVTGAESDLSVQSLGARVQGGRVHRTTASNALRISPVQQSMALAGGSTSRVQAARFARPVGVVRKCFSLHAFEQNIWRENLAYRHFSHCWQRRSFKSRLWSARSATRRRASPCDCENVPDLLGLKPGRRTQAHLHLPCTS